MAFLLPNLSPSLLSRTKSSPKDKVFHHPIISKHNSVSLYPPALSSAVTSLQIPTLQDAQVKTPPGAQDNKQHEKDDFYVNLGLAVRTLREDLPLLFTRDLNYDIYRWFSHLGIFSFLCFFVCFSRKFFLLLTRRGDCFLWLGFILLNFQTAHDLMFNSVNFLKFETL